MIREIDLAFIKLHILYHSAKEEVFGIGLVVAGTLAAFVGAFIGSRLIKKITMRTVQTIVGVLLLILSVSLGTGIL